MDKIRIYIALLFCQAISFILPVLAQNNTGNDSNWYNPYGGLMANSTNGRWHVMDPLCEKYYDVSPYAYCAGDGKGSLNQKTVGVAHEFAHVVLYLRNLPFGHRQPNVDNFVYGRSTFISKKLGYDY